MGRDAWPLVGRDEELEVITSFVREGRSLVLAGEAGIGKTRLQRELIAAVEAAGVPVKRAVATGSASSIAFGALAHLLPEISDEQTERYVVLRRMARALAGPESAPSMIAIDDAHLLDDLSAAVIHQVVTNTEATVVLTVRSGERVPDGISTLWKDGYVQRLDLQPLSRGETEMLLRSMLGGTITLRTMARFWQTSRGNPLFLRETVLGALDAGALSDRTGIWVWDDERPVTRFQEVVDHRLSGVGDTGLRGLEFLAVGEPLTSEMFEHLAPDVLSGLEDRRLVVERRENDRSLVRLVHPVYAEALRARLKPRVGQLLRRELVATFLREGLRKEDELRVAQLHLDSDDEPNVELLSTGFEMSLAATHFDVALRYVRRLLDAEPGLPYAGKAIHLLHRMGRAEEAFELVESYAGIEGPEDDRAAFALASSAVIRDLNGADEALDWLEREAAKLPAGHVWAERLDAHRIEQLWMIGRYEDVLELGFEAIERSSFDPYAHSFLVQSVALALTATGRSDDALQLVDGHIARLDTSEFRYLAAIIGAHVMALAHSGRADEAMSIVRSNYDWAVESGHEVARQSAAVGMAALLMARGQPVSALTYAREANAVQRTMNPTQSYFLGYEAEALALLGDAEAAAEAWDSRPAIRGAERADSMRQRAWIAAARGDLSEARRLAVASADASRDDDAVSDELMALYDAVRLGATEQTARLADLASRCQGSHAAAVGTHAAGLRDDDADMLAQASTQLAAIGRILCAAEASAQASMAYTRRGLRARASTAAARSTSLAERCEGARTPILTAGPRPDPLTRREREVALLASTGLTNREIAERLVASVRTVEGHLQKAYAKLGVSGRDSLAEALSENR